MPQSIRGENQSRAGKPKVRIMKQVVARNKHYEIGMDPGKNRAYLTIIGFWRSPEEVGPYVQDLEQALVQLKPGFTLLTDLTQMKAHPASVQPLHLEAQQLLLTRGLSQTAEVCASSMVEYQTNALSKKSNMPLRQFTDQGAAEAFLDAVPPTGS